MVISVCGMDCAQCNFYPEDCGGCSDTSGKPFWSSGLPEKTCRIYHCVNDKKLENCGGCHHLPCDHFFSVKDPDISEADHKKGIEERKARLKDNNPFPSPL